MSENSITLHTGAFSLAWVRNFFVAVPLAEIVPITFGTEMSPVPPFVTPIGVAFQVPVETVPSVVMFPLPCQLARSEAVR